MSHFFFIMKTRHDEIHSNNTYSHKVVSLSLLVKLHSWETTGDGFLCNPSEMFIYWIV